MLKLSKVQFSTLQLLDSMVVEKKKNQTTPVIWLDNRLCKTTVGAPY
jgi:hypothetical protein